MTKVIDQSANSHKLVNVTFDEDQMKIIRSLKGFGTEDAEIVRSIVIAYLSEHNYIKQASIDRDRSIEESDRKIKQESDESDRKYKLARARGNF
jgi:KaiC/GvpD/RAD55 family RecA-like ATPase